MSIEETSKRRDAQIRRVIAALAHKERDEAIAILCMWMPIEDVDRMLEILEH